MPNRPSKGASERDSLLEHDSKYDFHERAPYVLPTGQRWRLLCAVWTGVLFQGIDATIVSAMATRIGSSFDQLNRVSWLNTAYLLTHATFTPVYGKLSDVLGRRKTAAIAWSLFILGGLLAGLAPSMEFLIAARLLQGCGGGGLALTGSCVVSDICSLRERAVYGAMCGLAWAVGAGAGAPLGGLCVETIGWRWAFLLQVPIILIGLFALLRNLTYRLPTQDKTLSGRIDWMGAVTLIVAVGGTVLTLGLKTNEGMEWSDPRLIATLVVSLLALCIFFVVETKVAKEPVLALSLMRCRSRAACAALNFFNSSSTISVSLYYPMLLQIVRKTGAAEAGLQLVPGVVVGAVAGIFAGILIKRTCRYRLLIILMTMTIVPSLALLATVDQRTPSWAVWFFVTPKDFGASGAYSGTNVAMLSEVSADQFGTALGLLVLLRSLGQVFGLAGASAVQQSVLYRSLSSTISDPNMIESLRKSASVIDTLPLPEQAAVRGAFGASLHAVFVLAAVLACGTTFASFFIRELSLRRAVVKDDESTDPSEEQD